MRIRKLQQQSEDNKIKYSQEYFNGEISGYLDLFLFFYVFVCIMNIYFFD